MSSMELSRHVAQVPTLSYLRAERRLVGGNGETSPTRSVSPRVNDTALKYLADRGERWQESSWNTRLYTFILLNLPLQAIPIRVCSSLEYADKPMRSQDGSPLQLSQVTASTTRCSKTK